MAIVYDTKIQEGFKYIPGDQRSDSDPFTVVIKPISSRDLNKLQDNLLQRDAEDKISLIYRFYKRILLFALRFLDFL